MLRNEIEEKIRTYEVGNDPCIKISVAAIISEFEEIIMCIKNYCLEGGYLILTLDEKEVLKQQELRNASNPINCFEKNNKNF